MQSSRMLLLRRIKWEGRRRRMYLSFTCVSCSYWHGFFSASQVKYSFTPIWKGRWSNCYDLRVFFRVVNAYPDVGDGSWPSAVLEQRAARSLTQQNRGLPSQRGGVSGTDPQATRDTPRMVMPILYQEREGGLADNFLIRCGTSVYPCDCNVTEYLNSAFWVILEALPLEQGEKLL